VRAVPPDGQRWDSPVSIEIVVPAHNEAQRLPAGLTALCSKAASLPLPTAVVVVDSASTDGTGELVRDWPAGPVPVRLLRCDRPGKGLAVRTGLLATRAPLVGFCDADMATDLSALDLTLGLLAAGRHVVIGSRALEGSVVEERHSSIRRVGAATFRCLARRIVPGVSDTQCGFKFFSGPLARAVALPLRTTGFAFDIELIARCQRLGAALTEIPVTWRDVPGSTFSVPRHSAGIVRDIAAIWLSHRPARPPYSPAPLPVPPAVSPPALPAVSPPALPAAVRPA
jgi:glycosyltransferase involved in cell wall biosynthesis